MERFALKNLEFAEFALFADFFFFFFGHSICYLKQFALVDAFRFRHEKPLSDVTRFGVFVGTCSVRIAMSSSSRRVLGFVNSLCRSAANPDLQPSRHFAPMLALLLSPNHYLYLWVATLKVTGSVQKINSDKFTPIGVRFGSHSSRSLAARSLLLHLWINSLNFRYLREFGMLSTTNVGIKIKKTNFFVIFRKINYFCTKRQRVSRYV